MKIRPAEDRDLSGIQAIWNPIIRDTTITFASDQRDAIAIAAMIAARRAAGREFLVAEDGDAILGFVTYEQFRAGNGYAHAMEHTVMVSPVARGRGVGGALMAAIESHARDGGAHCMIAGVSAENAAGIVFHERIGYAHVARIPQVGRKFDRWLDLVLMQKFL
ncbi:phosphinothricin acetyltransferase [Albidovulum inexpectatum]|uniref:Phosphinothricin acetyltransferase n=1 Tax=Albidovulum inexpectatum TaxID=196587 RepID=A0A2S5JFW3_9RHOB|nr:GNAT family N-acetyltransferase [Albidovulum inexpectatum]PPB80320.1 phosphinothricin acetyltransferase [Albidovulum inexpectatum]